METIIKYNRPKSGVTSNSNISSIASTVAEATQQLPQHWKLSSGANALIPTESVNIAEGYNSIAIGTNTQTRNEGELSIGMFNNSTSGKTFFSVGDGTDDVHRHNMFEVRNDNVIAPSYSGNSANFSNYVYSPTVSGTNAYFSNVDSNSGNIRSLTSSTVVVNNQLTTNKLSAISGYIKTLLSEEITVDYLTVTKAAHFFKLIIDEIKATQGAVIISPANAVIDKVTNISGGWRCYYRAKDDDGKEIYNCFEVNDQIVCQTFNAATGTSYNVSNTYYWRLVTNTGSTSTTINGETKECHYFDLSSSDCDSHSMTPKVGDNCVQLGNRTDTTRQAAIIISAYNSQFLDSGLKAPSIVQYAGINNYNLSTHRLNVISNGLNQFKGSYKTTNNEDLEQLLNSGFTEVNNSISELVQTDESIKSTVSAHTTSITNLTNNLNAVSGTVTSHTNSISQLQQTASGLTSTVSAHTTSISSLTNNLNAVSGTVSAHTTNISQLQQTASGLSSSVQAIQNDYVVHSELTQTANNIELNVYNNINEKTGIDISSGHITIDADNTTFLGNITLENPNDGIIIKDGNGNPRINIQNNELGTLENFDFGLNNNCKLSGSKSYSSPQTSISYTFSAATLGTLTSGQRLKLSNMGFGGHWQTLPFDEDGINSATYSYVIKCGSTTVYSTNGTATKNSEKYPYEWRITDYTNNSVGYSGKYAITLTVTFSLTSNPKYVGKFFLYGFVNAHAPSTNVNRIAIDGAVFASGTDKYNWFGSDKTQIRNGNSILRAYDGKLQRNSYNAGANSVGNYFSDISSTVPYRIINVSSHTATLDDCMIVFSTMVGSNPTRYLTLPSPSSCPGKMYFVKNIVAGSNTVVKCTSSNAFIWHADASHENDVSFGLDSNFFISCGLYWISFNCD